jgi:hypothetical protein
VGTAVSYFSVAGTLQHTGDGVAEDNTIANNLLGQLGSGTLSDFWMDNINPLHISCKWNGAPVFSTDGGASWVKPTTPYQQAQCIAPNGNLLCFQTPNDVTLNFATSPDGGETWAQGSVTLPSPVQVQYQPALTSDRLWTDTAGNIWLSLTGENNLYPNQAWPVQVVKSSNNGQSFAVTGNFTGFNQPYGAGMFVIGTTLLLVMPLAGSSGAPQNNFLIARSTDGTTFTGVLSVSGYNTAMNSSHGTIAALADGSLVVPLVECDGTGQVIGPMILYVSTDQGQTWTTGRTLPGSGNVPREMTGDSGAYAYLTTWTVPTYLNDQPTAKYYWQSANSAGSWQTAPAWFTGFSAAFAPAGSRVFWGVDSLTPANQATKSYPDLFSALKAQTGGVAPAFWGRYIGNTGNLTSSEVTFLHARNCKILLIDRGTTVKTGGKYTVQTYQDGVNHANAAITSASTLGVPAGCWIFADIEYPAMSPTQSFFQGWFDTFAGSIYKGGAYGNTSSGASSQFNTPLCNAYTSDANMKNTAYVYTNQPVGGELACNFNTSTVLFNPTIPPCSPPTVVLQYSINCVADPSDSKNSQVDLDTANAVGVASMW